MSSSDRSESELRPGVLLLDAFDSEVDRWLPELEQAGVAVRRASGAETWRGVLREFVTDVVVVELAGAGQGTPELVRALKQRDPRLPVLLLVPGSDGPLLRRALEAGADDFLVSPVSGLKLATSVRLAARLRQLAVGETAPDAEPTPAGGGRIVGRSQVMRSVFAQVRRVAPADVPVMIQGESGTGKELIARALHEQSGRRGNFIAVNCAAIPENLLESEFFGHEKGAFTGAVQRRIGQIELAHGGTLFLDEIAELPLALQAKLLRVLQEPVFTRVGGTEPVRSDFRLVTATHASLLERVRAGRFREDLYFRLAVFELELPPLRERDGDIVLLAHHFLDAASGGRADLAFDFDSLALMERYAWPGNVRELENAIRRAVVLADGTLVQAAHFPPRVRAALEGLEYAGAEEEERPVVALQPAMMAAGAGAAAEPAVRGGLAEVERMAIERVFHQCGGNISQAARTLGIGRNTLYRKLRQYGMRV